MHKTEISSNTSQSSESVQSKIGTLVPRYHIRQWAAEPGWARGQRWMRRVSIERVGLGHWSRAIRQSRDTSGEDQTTNNRSTCNDHFVIDIISTQTVWFLTKHQESCPIKWIAKVVLYLKPQKHIHVTSSWSVYVHSAQAVLMVSSWVWSWNASSHGHWDIFSDIEK